VRPTVRKVLDSLQGIPTDIEPIFVTADELAPVVKRAPNAGPARKKTPSK